MGCQNPSSHTPPPPLLPSIPRVPHSRILCHNHRTSIEIMCVRGAVAAEQNIPNQPLEFSFNRIPIPLYLQANNI